MNIFPGTNEMPDILGYGQRPSGFTALMLALSRLGFPGGAGLGYPMAAAGPTATMGPSFAPYGQMPYGQMPYGQMPYGQMPYGQMPYGQMPYGMPLGAAGWDGTQMQNQYMAALQAQALTQQQLMQGQSAGQVYGQ